jgi:flagella basal body P-ring formation protein FlgA
MIRSLILATLLMFATLNAAAPQTAANVPGLAPVLRPAVSVSGELVRIGDFVENAGDAAQIAVFRAPDLGTSGTVPTEQILEALRAHNVFGVETRDIREVTVSRLARVLTQKDIENAIGLAIENRNGLGAAANLTMNFDRDIRLIYLDPSSRGGLLAVASRYEPRNSRFDVTFEIAGDQAVPTRLRFTGTAVETVEAAVVTRNVERGDILKASDITIERRPKAEAAGDVAQRARAVGMQTRRAIRMGQILRMADLAKADLVQRDQNVSLIYEAPGIYLTMRGKAIDAGTEGDTVSVMNLQSKRVVQGIVSGPGQVTMSPVVPRRTLALSQNSSADPTALTE